MNRVKILHNGGGWITNIGNAFLDMGSTHSLRMACPEGTVYVTSVLNRWISHHVNKGMKGIIQKNKVPFANVFNLQDYADVDYIVQSGAFLAKHWFELHGHILQNLADKGIKLIINGGGMTDSTYSENDIIETREYLKKLKPYIFISRDTVSFENYKDLAEYSYDGIDCAFFLSDAYQPFELNLPPYNILNFDKQNEPSKDELEIDVNKYIIRTHHSFWHNFALSNYLKMKKQYYMKENTMISEIPYDYLDLYANTCGTYSDRVHACVATLSYGKPARLFNKSPRTLLFSKVGAKEISNKLVMPDLTIIEKEKKKQIEFLAEVLKRK